MALDPRNASWHPAMMPNSASELEQLPRQEQPPSNARKPAVPIPEQSTNVSNSPDNAHDPFDPSAADDAWFPEYDAGGEQRPTGEDVAQRQPDEPAYAHKAEERPQATEESSAAGQDVGAPGHANKHLSTMSFTRTVSHEFNWNDDDETDFNLQKMEPDPFKFMPPNDRTNSFPVVPPLQSPHVEEIEHPLSANPAVDIVNEVERQDEIEEAEEAHKGIASAFADSNDDDFLADLHSGSDQPQYIGGDVQGSSEETSDARYAEGLPLVARDEDEDDSHETGHSSRAAPGLEDAFGADEDDFFSKVQDVSSHETQEPEPAPLERKTTIQVLDNMGMGEAAADMATVEESPEENEMSESAAHAEDGATQQESVVDLDAKWKEVFAEDDDEEFLPDDTSEENHVDPSAFFGDDDEGFLNDIDEPATQPTEPAPLTVASPVTAAPVQPLQNRYLPTGQPTAASTPANPYLPAASPFVVQPSASFPVPAPASVPSMASGLPYGAPPPRPEPNKAQSFVDKKGGYQSPYDLPMEVVKPRKRVSMQNLQRPPAVPQAPPVGPVAPPRSASMYAQAPPPTTTGSIGSLSPPSAQGLRPAATAPKAAASKAKEAFFEDLPLVAKPRPASRHSTKGLTSPSQTSPYGPPTTTQPPVHVASPPAAQYIPQQQVVPPPPSAPAVPNLVAPGRVSPYAPLESSPSLAPSIPPAQTSRYSPAPPTVPHLNGVPPPAPPSRYSPAPPGSRPLSAGVAAAAVGPAPPVLPHQPRTSSPLAHFEISHDRSRLSSDTSYSDRRGSSTYEQRLQRVPSLPPTREVEEEEGAGETQANGQGMVSPPFAEQRQSFPHRSRQTPPPPALASQASLSPPKRVRSNYSPSPMGVPQSFAPPQRSQTQSPGALHSRGIGPKPVDPIPRPSSVHGPTSPRTAAPLATFPQPAAPGQTSPAATRQRGFSQNLNLIAPTDGREHDPLQRWKGVPVIAWGVGGTVVTSFPKDVPRYGMGQSAPMVVRSPGEVKVQTIKELEPLEERLSKFPGPLKGKSKKKETLAWLTAGIDTLEALQPRNLAFQSHVSHEDKRAEERILLWKILRLFVEHDGVLDGNPTVEQAVREILSPNLAPNGPASPVLTTGANAGPLAGSGAATMHADAIDPSSIEELRNYLLSGDREKAVWAAADKRLWGHAMLIANTVSQDLYKKVTQEFVKKEVNSPGHNNESLAALYEVLSGNYEDCVDELVPVHARAGLQLLAMDSGTNAAKDVAEGLDKWRETLSLILSNRSADDARAMKSLGELLSSYGRAEAAHICFMFAKNQAVFGGLDDPNSNFVLLGSDHRRQVEQFAKEAEPLLLSEVYEYGLSLAGGSNVPVNTAHLAGYKYQHALTLAEYGFKDKALQYCDAILSAVAAQTRRSPYHHALLEAAVEDLSKRLKLAPKEGSNSWIPKPSMNKVSDSVWNRFNKFVAGDDNESSGQGSPTHGIESGPFARIGGGTPTISRPPSAAGQEGFGTVPGYSMISGPVAPQIPPAAAATKTASRYAPGAQSTPAVGSPYEPSAYAPRSSTERSSSEFNRSSFEMSRPSMDMHKTSYGNAYIPSNVSSAAQGFQPANGTAGMGLSSLSRESSYMPVSQPDSLDSQPPPLNSASSDYRSQEPSRGHAESAPNGTYFPPPAAAEAHHVTSAAGYQPASYGYEPPSSTAQEVPQDAPTEPKDESRETNGGYEAPSYQPYGYEPPSYQPDPTPAEDGSDEESRPKPKKRGPMYDDEDDDLVVAKTREKTKEEKDRENAEMFRKVAEEEAKRAQEAAKSQPKKGWLGGWFGGKKESTSPEPQQASGTPGKPIRAKLGEANSFYYDPEQKRWVNKNASAEDQVKKTATPPPPRGPSGGSASARSTPPPPPAAGHPDGGEGRASAPPGGPPRTVSVTSAPHGPAAGGPPAAAAAADKLTPGGPVSMMRSGSNTSVASGPPSRPTTSMSNASSIDDLLGGVGPRAKGAAKKKKGGRYVDVMAKS